VAVLLLLYCLLSPICLINLCLPPLLSEAVLLSSISSYLPAAYLPESLPPFHPLLAYTLPPPHTLPTYPLALTLTWYTLPLPSCSCLLACLRHCHCHCRRDRRPGVNDKQQHGMRTGRRRAPSLYLPTFLPAPLSLPPPCQPTSCPWAGHGRRTSVSWRTACRRLTACLYLHICPAARACGRQILALRARLKPLRQAGMRADVAERAALARALRPPASPAPINV